MDSVYREIREGTFNFGEWERECDKNAGKSLNREELIRQLAADILDELNQ